MNRVRLQFGSLLRSADARSYSPALCLLLLLPALLLLGIGFFYPVLSFLMTSFFDPDFTLKNYAEIAQDEVVSLTIARTLWISGASAALCLLFGLPVAYLMARARGVWAAIIAASILVPLWTSVLMRTFAWTVIFQYNGLLNKAMIGLGLIHQPLRMMYSTPAMLIVMVHVLLPYMILPIYTNLQAIPGEYIKAARSLGASDARTALHVVLPLCLPGVTAGSVLVFLIALGFFIIPALVGGPHNMMIATLIGRQVTSTLNWPLAAAMSAVLLLVTLAILLLFNKALRFDRRFTG